MSTKTDDLLRAYSYGLITFEQLTVRLKEIAAWAEFTKELTREAC